MEEVERQLAAERTPEREPAPAEEPERIEPTEAAPKADRELPEPEDEPHK